MAIEAVAAISASSSDADDPFVFLDLANTIRVNEKLDVIVRPYARRLPGGDWDALLYQAQIRYQPAERVRLDAGIIASPLGLGTFELRQDLNPLVGSPFYYFAPLPAFERPSDRVQLFSGGYPLGAILSVSGRWWDARTGITDGTPARYRKILRTTTRRRPLSSSPGRGSRPCRGSASAPASRTAHIAARTIRTTTDCPTTRCSPTRMPPSSTSRPSAIAYTRLSGEWVRDSFENDGSPAVSRGFYVQGVQTITPRIFTAARFTRVSAPVLVSTTVARSTRKALELSGGYRITPQITVKAGYEGGQRFNVTDWTHAAVASVVWSRRWF